MKTRLLLLCGLTACLGGSLATGCGEDEPPDVLGACEGDVRLVVKGQVGPTAFDRRQPEPYPGPISGTVFSAVLEDGALPHGIVFSSNVTLDDGSTDLRTAIYFRLESGAENAGRLDVVSRPADTACDPREGVICAAYGVDANADGRLTGDEVSYPVESGVATFTSSTGNQIAASFDITFGAQAEGDAEGGQEGGNLAGCFRYFLTPDHSSLY